MIAAATDFVDFIGSKFYHVSIAYQYDTTQPAFPPMLYVSFNKNSATISANMDLTSFNFNSIKINKVVMGLFSRFYVYNQVSLAYFFSS